MTENNVQSAPQIRFKGFTDAWVQRKLGEVFEFYSGLTYSPDNVIESGGTLVLRSSNVVDGEIIDADNVYVESDVVNCNNVEIGDVIVVVRNGSRSLIGKHAQVKKQMKDTVIGAFMTGLRSSQPEFANVLLDTQQFDVEITKNLGATINQITTGAFKQMTFSMPQASSEQTAIGNFFRTLDTTITLHKRKLDGLKELKNGYLQQMFPQDGESVPRVRFAGFTGNWETRMLMEISSKVTEKNSDREFAETLTNSAEHGIISQRDFFDKDISNEKNLGGYFIVRPNDFVYNPRISNFAPVGPIKRNLLGRTGVMSPLYYVFRVAAGNLTYIEKYFESVYWHEFMKLNGDNGVRADRFNIKDSVFEEMPIPFPSLSEQKAIGELFHNLDNQIVAQQTKLDNLKQLKSAYLQKMFI